ncbi:MAG: bifunctional serine/threonine-protein kinase/formylglycine-generating enzyme family protein [Vicinamibacteria bacterium]
MSAGPQSGRERWDEIQRLFTEALELPSTDRARFVKEAATDTLVHDEVVSLLAAHARVTGPLDGPSPRLPLPEETLLPGERLGPYEIAAPLGRGGMGVLFVAHDTRLGRDVAVKLLAPWLAGEPRALRRFEREGRAVAALAHPNIVSLFDVGREGERVYAVMELLEGETLRERLERGPLAVREALRVARDVARGLAAAHAKGLVHRDLKPENVFLARTGAKILDFGIARVIADATDSSADIAIEAGKDPAAGTAIAGTAGYLSPEQARRHPADARSDVFAFGCVFYEALTGRRAFEAHDLRSAIAAVLRDEPAPLRRTRPDTPKALAAIVERCLRKPAGDRFASGQELSDALEPLAAAAEAAVHRRARWRLVAGLGTAAVVVAAAATWGYHLWRTRDILPTSPGGLVFRTNAKDGAEYSRIPPGSFRMGCDPKGPRTRVDCGADPVTFVDVTIARPYWMMRTEVTVAMFRAFSKATGTPVPGRDREEDPEPTMKGLLPKLLARDDNPIVGVNWFEADAYCRWAGGRLPSESEWERAARANHDWDYAWGVRDLVPGTPPLANVADESLYRTYGPHVLQDGTVSHDAHYKGYDDGFPDLAPVASFPANDFGLYDMAGNVSHWVEDQGIAVFQNAPLEGHPKDGSPRLDRNPAVRMTRSAGWGFGPNNHHVWARYAVSAYGHSPAVGFRCVRDTAP